eukprot:scaffold3167_cov105-Isochrysis_galbana.AAC.4
MTAADPTLVAADPTFFLALAAAPSAAPVNAPRIAPIAAASRPAPAAPPARRGEPKAPPPPPNRAGPFGFGWIPYVPDVLSRYGIDLHCEAFTLDRLCPGGAPAPRFTAVAAGETLGVLCLCAQDSEGRLYASDRHWSPLREQLLTPVSGPARFSLARRLLSVPEPLALFEVWSVPLGCWCGPTSIIFGRRARGRMTRYAGDVVSRAGGRPGSALGRHVGVRGAAEFQKYDTGTLHKTDTFLI